MEYMNTEYGFAHYSGEEGALRSRICKPTDWAKARGVIYSRDAGTFFNGKYWTRSPDDDNKKWAYFIDYDGSLTYCGAVETTYYGVRPGLILDIF